VHFSIQNGKKEVSQEACSHVKPLQMVRCLATDVAGYYKVTTSEIFYITMMVLVRSDRKFVDRIWGIWLS
jgi:hypothetical protein